MTDTISASLISRAASNQGEHQLASHSLQFDEAAVTRCISDSKFASYKRLILFASHPPEPNRRSSHELRFTTLGLHRMENRGLSVRTHRHYVCVSLWINLPCFVFGLVNTQLQQIQRHSLDLKPACADIKEIFARPTVPNPSLFWRLNSLHSRTFSVTDQALRFASYGLPVSLSHLSKSVAR